MGLVNEYIDINSQLLPFHSSASLRDDPNKLNVLISELFTTTLIRVWTIRRMQRMKMQKDDEIALHLRRRWMTSQLNRVGYLRFHLCMQSDIWLC